MPFRFALIPLTISLLAILLLVEHAPAAGGSVDTVRGTVADASGRPLFSAHVELRSAGRTVVSTRTRADGGFELRPRGLPGEGGWELRVSSLGYVTRELSVEPGAAPLEIVLSAAPLPIEGIEIEGTREICGVGDDPTARALWAVAARKHLTGLDTLGMASYTRLRVDTLAAPTGTQPGMAGAEGGQRGSAPILRLSWARRMEREGYAYRVRRTDRERSFDSWSYPPLEADYSAHFGASIFGRLNEFQIDQAWEDGWRLSFCSRNARRPQLLGTLELGADTAMVRADWRFRTSEPDERAGGWVRFAPPMGEGGLRHLLPLESLTWRQGPDSLTVRRAQWYEEWILAPGDSVPFLPTRVGPLPPLER